MTTYQEALDAYLAAPDRNETALAEAIGKSQGSVNRYRRGERFPDAATARLIDASTQGAVPFSLWRAEFLRNSGLAA
jgi:transcriptional regulator with XRE-family HTH domain